MLDTTKYRLVKVLSRRPCAATDNENNNVQDPELLLYWQSTETEAHSEDETTAEGPGVIECMSSETLAASVGHLKTVKFMNAYTYFRSLCPHGKNPISASLWNSRSTAASGRAGSLVKRASMQRIAHFMQSSCQAYLNEGHIHSAVQLLDSCLDSRHVPTRQLIRQIGVDCVLQSSECGKDEYEYCMRFMLSLISRFGIVAVDGMWIRAQLDSAEFASVTDNAADVDDLSNRRQSMKRAHAGSLDHKSAPYGLIQLIGFAIDNISVDDDETSAHERAVSFLYLIIRVLEQDYFEAYQSIDNGDKFVCSFGRACNDFGGFKEVLRELLPKSLHLFRQTESDKHAVLRDCIGRFFSILNSFWTLGGHDDSLLDSAFKNDVLLALDHSEVVELHMLTSSASYLFMHIYDEIFVQNVSLFIPSSFDRSRVHGKISSEKIRDHYLSVRPKSTYRKNELTKIHDLLKVIFMILVTWTSVDQEILVTVRGESNQFIQAWSRHFTDELESDFANILKASESHA